MLKKHPGILWPIRPAAPQDALTPFGSSAMFRHILTRNIQAKAPVFKRACFISGQLFFSAIKAFSLPMNVCRSL